MAQRLGLGTAQFGSDYGLSNSGMKCPADEVRRILEFADLHSIRLLDTAASYGESEETLGSTLPPAHCFTVVTKTPAFLSRTIHKEDATFLVETFMRSLSRLGLTKVYGLLVHQTKDLLASGGERLFEAMINLKERGLVRKIGISVYTSSEIDSVLDRYAIDLIQVPVSVFDQRLIFSGHLTKLHSEGIEIHIRSAFLQGLLLLEPARVPEYFAPIRSHLRDYHHAISELGISTLEAALGFVGNLSEAECILVGVGSRNELMEILKINTASYPGLDFRRFSVSDEKIINPSNWPIFRRE